MKAKKNRIEEITTLNGMMTFGMNDKGQKMLDFVCTEGAEIEPFTADCKVQAMHTGDVYITEKPRRVKNTPLFREDNCTLTLGRDGRYYVVFTMEKGRLKELPERLVRQSLAIARKVERMVAGRVEKKGSRK